MPKCAMRSAPSATRPLTGRAGGARLEELGLGVWAERLPADLREDRLLTPREAAQLLRVSVETLRAMPVPYLTIGAGQKRPRRRYVRQHVLDWCRRRAMP
jgi:hypothetical protein